MRYCVQERKKMLRKFRFVFSLIQCYCSEVSMLCHLAKQKSIKGKIWACFPSPLGRKKKESEGWKKPYFFDILRKWCHCIPKAQWVRTDYGFANPDCRLQVYREEDPGFPVRYPTSKWLKDKSRLSGHLEKVIGITIFKSHTYIWICSNIFSRFQSILLSWYIFHIFSAVVVLILLTKGKLEMYTKLHSHSYVIRSHPLHVP